MSEIARPSTGNPMILVKSGVFCLLGGFFMFAARASFASFFLGANFLFGIPLTGGDVFKVLFFEGVSVVTLGMGLVLLIVGLILKSKAQSESAPGSPAVP
jgi:hypothetical protein